MNQFANYFNIAPAFRVASASNNTLIIKSGYEPDGFLTRNEVDPKTSTDDTTAGIIYTFELEAAVGKITETERRIYANNPPVILELFNADTHQSILIGTIENPCNIVLIPSLDYDQFKITFSSTTPVL